MVRGRDGALRRPRRVQRRNSGQNAFARGRVCSAPLWRARAGRGHRGAMSLPFQRRQRGIFVKPQPKNKFSPAGTA